MSTNTRIPLPRQRQQQIERQRKIYEAKEKQKRRRRRILILKRVAFLCFIALICVFLAWMIVKFISNNIGDNKPGDEYEEETGQSQEASEENAENEEHGQIIDFSELIDPSTLNPNDRIDLYYMADQTLPKVYYTSATPYTTFADDNPVLGSNINTRVIVIDAGHQEETRKSDVWLSPYLDPSKNDTWVHNSLLTIGATGSSTKIPEHETTHTIAAKLTTAEKRACSAARRDRGTACAGSQACHNPCS